MTRGPTSQMMAQKTPQSKPLAQEIQFRKQSFLKLKFTLRQVSWPGLLAYEFIEFIGERDAVGSSKNS